MLNVIKKNRQYSVDYNKYGFIENPTNPSTPVCLICQKTEVLIFKIIVDECTHLIKFVINTTITRYLTYVPNIYCMIRRG